MNFVKGILVGTIVSAGVAMVYSETTGNGKKKMMRTGKKIAKKMGLM